MQSRSVVILGGGIGGIIAANELRRKLGGQHRVVLVERNAQHAFAPSFLWLMTGDRETAQVCRPLAALLRPGIELCHGEATGIDTVRRRVQTSAGERGYDYLVVAVGAELAAAPEAHSFYTFAGAAKLREALESFSGRRIAVVIAALPFKCPAAPYEGAMLIADFFRKRGQKVHLHLFTPEPQPMPVAGPQLGQAVQGMLGEKGITFYPLHKLAAVAAESRELVFEQGRPFAYDLLVAVPPHQAPQVVREAGLTNPAGWIAVDPRTLATPHENVYAIGDVTALPIPGRWKPDAPLLLPKAGVFAHRQAEVVAARIAAEISGRAPQAEFCGDGYCMLEAGGDMAGFAFGNFFAEPSPQVELRTIGKAWHWGKVLLEKWWLSPIGRKRDLLAAALRAGGRLYGVPVGI
jgi:sulfide:quinone oxidoreductase